MSRSTHVQVAEMVIEKAKRLVEHKKDVVGARLHRTSQQAYNTVVPPSGKICPVVSTRTLFTSQSDSLVPHGTSKRAAA